ncbi:GNAT family N-acetyltransferase [Pseudomonas sp. MAP12]|uniref:GNAT family N-acetyltransferase n=1 Tax=Geopseudomonas aromaticivorans TaxID=2849492 RepID=A0ABS6N0G0_9GAMM|nr:GNAT family N-acetyltransferase [Pseudomonas aromaticivorans]MBV2134541.1 GNAT family N-acetyltransferase [Pseudomonas aromaticivorans]
MNELHFGLLAPALQPLLGKFYRAHRSPMRAPPEAQTWVVRQTEILGALNLSPVGGGHWLTGLLVAPAQRRQGLASRLIEHALAQTPGPVWLFCHPQLADFYTGLGFTLAAELPAPLAERLARYRQHKTLIALARHATLHQSTVG